MGSHRVIRAGGPVTRRQFIASSLGSAAALSVLPSWAEALAAQRQAAFVPADRPLRLAFAGIGNRGAEGYSSRASRVCRASRSTSHKAATVIGVVVANVLSISRPRLPMPANASLRGRSAGTKARGRCVASAAAQEGMTASEAAVPSD